MDDNKTTTCSGFNTPVPVNNPDKYDRYCIFHFVDEHDTKWRCTFPPICRNDIYGGMMESEIRHAAMDRLNDLEKRYGEYGDITVEIT